MASARCAPEPGHNLDTEPGTRDTGSVAECGHHSRPLYGHQQTRAGVRGEGGSLELSTLVLNIPISHIHILVSWSDLQFLKTSFFIIKVYFVRE